MKWFVLLGEFCDIKKFLKIFQKYWLERNF